MTLTQCTSEELDRRAQRAEQDMNLALEARRWNLVQRHRAEMLAVADECARRARDFGEGSDAAAEVHPG